MAKAVIQTGITADVSGFKRGLMEAEQGAARFKNGQIRQLGSMIGGAFAVTAVVGFARRTLEAADNIQDMSENLGMGTEHLQALETMAKRAGSSAEYMQQVLMRASRAGVGIEDVAKAMTGQEVAGLSAADAATILGRGGAQLNTVMQTLADEGLQSVTDKLLENNEIMSNATVQSAALMQAAYERMGDTIKTKLGNIVIEFIGGLGAIDKLIQGYSWDEISKEMFGDLSANSRTTALTKAGPSSKVAKSIASGKGAKNISMDFAAPEATDSLAKIGGLVGIQSNPTKTVLEAQLKAQQKMIDSLEDIKVNMKSVKQNTDTFKED